MPTETTIILAIVGMIGLFATATVYQRANRISSRYYSKFVQLSEDTELSEEEMDEVCSDEMRY